ncbi:MAG: transposase [Acidobacteria bacterium]|nr:transposase [Acidobacteriota bacterium]
MARRRFPYIPGELQFITSSTYRRSSLFRSQRFCRCFVDALIDVRKSTGFLLIGWVLMSEHFHLLLKPLSAEATSRIMQRLKNRTATSILKELRENQDGKWCRKMLARLALPPTVHDESHHRVWQRRFYPYGIYTENKQSEKLDYIHNNPVTRGLVSAPGEWPWSSWRFCSLEDTSLMAMDPVE